MTTNGTGQSESRVSFGFITIITTMIPIILKNCTTTSCVMRSMKDCSVEVSPLMRLMTAPVEVLS